MTPRPKFSRRMSDHSRVSCHDSAVDILVGVLCHVQLHHPRPLFWRFALLLLGKEI